MMTDTEEKIRAYCTDLGDPEDVVMRDGVQLAACKDLCTHADCRLANALLAVLGEPTFTPVDRPDLVVISRAHALEVIGKALGVDR